MKQRNLKVSGYHMFQARIKKLKRDMMFRPLSPAAKERVEMEIEKLVDQMLNR